MKILTLSLLLSYLACHDRHEYSNPVIVQAHCINEKNELLLCNEAGKLNVPMGFITWQDQDSTSCAQRIVQENVGLNSSDWLEFGQFDALVQDPAIDGMQPQKFHVSLMITQKFNGTVIPDPFLYTDCRWYNTNRMPDDGQLSNLSLYRQQLQNLLRITQARNKQQ